MSRWDERLKARVEETCLTYTGRTTREKSTSVMCKRAIRTRWQLLKKCPKPWLCCILETKANDGNTTAKTPDPRTNPNTKEAPTAPKPHTHPSHELDGQESNPGVMTVPPTPKTTRKAEVLPRVPPTITSRREEDSALKKWPKPRL